MTHLRQVEPSIGQFETPDQRISFVMDPRVHDGRDVHLVVDHVTLMSLLIDHLQQLAAIGRAVLAEMVRFNE